MTLSTSSIFIIFFVHLSSIFHPSHGFKVLQSQSVPASIICEHTANTSSVEDFRLYSISLRDKSSRILLCQKGWKDCKNIIMHQEKPSKFLFIILNVGPEDMNMTYQCEFTVKIDDVDITRKGTPTTLLQGEKKVACGCHPPPLPTLPPTSPLSHRPPPAQVGWLWWIVSGLLALVFLYSCVITFLYFRWRCCTKDPEDCTYVEMTPLPSNQRLNVCNR